MEVLPNRCAFCENKFIDKDESNKIIHPHSRHLIPDGGDWVSRNMIRFSDKFSSQILKPRYYVCDECFKKYEDYKKMDLKQVVIIRSDLGMSKGKMVSAGCHVSLFAYRWAFLQNPLLCLAWEEGSYFKKIVLKVDNIEQLKKIYSDAFPSQLPVYAVADKGFTQVKEGTVTAVAIGPAASKEIDKIAGKLKLL